MSNIYFVCFETRQHLTNVTTFFGVDKSSRKKATLKAFFDVIVAAGTGNSTSPCLPVAPTTHTVVAPTGGFTRTTKQTAPPFRAARGWKTL